MVSNMHAHLHRRHGVAVPKVEDEVVEIARRAELEIEERDHRHNGDGDPGAAATLVSVVYVTASPTFSGPVAGFTTISVGNSPDPSPQPSPSPSPSPEPSPSPSPSPSPETSAAAATSNSPEPASTTPAAATSAQPSAKSSPSSSLAQSIKSIATDSSSSASTHSIANASPTGNNAGDAAAASSTPSSGAVITNNSTDSGLSGGAKAGIAIGVILAVLALAAGAFALYRLRKRKMEEAYDANMQNEKGSPFADSAAAAPPPNEAPTLPAMGAMAATGTPIHDAEKRAASPTNPFGPGAETVRDVPSSAGIPRAPSIGENEKIAVGTGVGAAAAAAGMATATTAKRTSVPAPLKINRSQSPALAPPAQASPAASNFSDTSMTPSAVAAATSTGQNLKMHRVQMDFTPTMDDELKIRAGEIVEVMHEYDDGWCLCKIVRRNNEGASRIDRGVVPRTCLSRLPLKPRTNGQKRQGPPAVVPTTRTDSPSPTPDTAPAASSAPRAQSPALTANPNKRSVSPGPYGGGPESKPQIVSRDRSNSMSDLKKAPKEALAPSPLNTTDNSKDISLPIQIPALETPRIVGQTDSVPSSPVTRKPVPKKQE